MRSLLLTALLGLCLGCSSIAVSPDGSMSDKAGDEKPAAAFAKAVEDLELKQGLLDLYLDPEEHKVWLSVPTDSRLMGEYLYVEGLRSGLGSNPVGLDRGQLGETRFVRFEVHAGRFLIREPNLSYRANSDDPLEVRAVEESFASSVLWSAPIQHAKGGQQGLVDLSGFLLRDAHDVSGTLKRTEQGSFELDAERSVLLFDELLAFPDNVELEALLTFKGKDPGRFVRSTAPSADSVSLVLHQSFIRAPDDGYTPRRLDPRAGSFGISFADYGVDLDEPIRQQWLVRHRLEKVTPGAAPSEVKEPIVYYVDRGAPEPVRSALIEGAAWWATAFEKAGFLNAYRIEVLPEGAHPLDSRYNVIQWVHRSTRGWSYGGGVTDPRTGEMVKGHVSLGSLRVRQDRTIFEGLLGAAKSGTGVADDPVELALARIRQLSAHEVGHTLGFTHNFAASSYGRASVMDYPAPWVTVDENGVIDVSQAYAVGVGAWDDHTVRYAYSEFDAGADEADELEKIVLEGLDDGLLFLSDNDARPLGAAVAEASLWDNGSDAIEALDELLELRRVALARFGPDRLGQGRPLAELEEVLATVYFHHRYQLEATAKLVGGVRYEYSFPGAGLQTVEPVAAERQERALALVLSTLAPSELDLPEDVLRALLPRPFGSWRNREQFAQQTGLTFDALGAAASAADFTVRLLTEPSRAARLIDLHRRDADLPGYQRVLDELIEQSFAPASAGEPPVTARLAEIARTVQRVVVSRLLEQVAAEATPGAVRTRAVAALAEIEQRLSAESSKAQSSEDRQELAHRMDLQRRLDVLSRAQVVLQMPSDPGAPMPPGSPIGSTSDRQAASGSGASPNGHLDCSFGRHDL